MGVTSSNPFEQKIKQTAMEASLRKFLLLDSSKFGVVQTSYFADITDFDAIVTDDGIPESYVQLIQEAGIELHVG